MAIELPLLDQVTVATPCSIPWDSMQGDERVRHCRHCQKNVYNFSAMTRVEVVALVQEKEGKLCGRVFRRADGTLLTSDCPVGLREVRRRLVRAVCGIAATMVALIGGAAWSRSESGKLSGVDSVIKDGPLTRFANWLEPQVFPFAGDICLSPVNPQPASPNSPVEP